MWEIDYRYFNEKKPLTDEFDLMVGREEECRKILHTKEENTEEDLLLWGYKGVGKTTMLNWAKKHFGGIIISFGGNTTVNVYEFQMSFLEKLVRYVLNHKGKFSERTLKMVGEIQKNILRVAHIPSSHVILGPFIEGSIEDLARAMVEDTGERIYIYLDDFNKIINPEAEDLRRAFNVFYSVHTELWSTIMAISTLTYRKLEVIDGAFLDRFSVKIRIGYLNDDVAVELIKKRLEKGIIGRRVDELYPFTFTGISYLVEESGGAPRRIIENTKIVLKYAKQRGIERISKDVVNKAMKDEGIGIFWQGLHALGDNAVAIYQYIQEYGENGVHPIDIARGFGWSKSRITYWLDKLEEGGYIRREQISKRNVLIYPESPLGGEE